MATAASTINQRPVVVTDLGDAVRSVVSSLWNAAMHAVFLTLFAVATAWPLAWLWDRTAVAVVSVLTPIGDDFWAAVVVVLGLVGVLRFLGLAAAGDTDRANLTQPVDTVVRIVAAAATIWAVFGAAWVVLKLTS